MITTANLQRIAVSTAGALLFSGLSVVAAVAPAQAQSVNAPATIGDWQAAVEDRIDNTLRVPRNAALKPMAAATVRVRFDANGAFAGARIAQSTGNAALDREALRTAGQVRYPALPEGLRGRSQTVEMKLFFGSSPHDVMAARHLARGEAQVSADRMNDKDQIAALPTG